MINSIKDSKLLFDNYDAILKINNNWKKC